MDTNNAKLFGKIAAVMGSVRRLPKTGTNTYDRYDYMTADAIAQHIGSALADAGVAFLPSIVGVETSEYTTAKGATNFRTVVNMQLTFACSETGATFTILWSGEAIDRSDKSISKAAVSAVKYALIKTFLLSGGDDDDADAQSPEVEVRKVAPAPKPPITNGYHDDEMWEPHETVKAADLLSKSQLTRITVLGVDAYGKAEFDSQSGKLAGWASNNKVTSLGDLNPKQADVLIKALEKRVKEIQAEKEPA